MRVSVVIPTFNRLPMLIRAIESVRAQSYPVSEICVVDDASTDGTREWLIKQPDLKLFFSDKNQGVSESRNRGLKLVSSPWLALLDSDDSWEPAKIEEQFALLNANPGHMVCHTAERWMRNNQPVSVSINAGKRSGWIYSSCLPLCTISPSSVLFHRSVYDSVGAFDVSLPACEDYDYWLRLTSRYPVLFVDKPLVVKYGGHADQLSRKYWGMDRFRIDALVKSLNSGILNPEQIKLTSDMLRKKIEIYLIGAKKRNKVEEIKYYEALISSYC